jgi:ABC-type lipoprotein export system ATPase subunit
MGEPIIRIEKVTRTYQVGEVDVHALRGVSLVVEPGEFVAIMGSSGSGKPTLMAILDCLDRPTSGDYHFEGVDVARLSEPELARLRSERLGFVFQSFNLPARTSAIENSALPLFCAASGPSGAGEWLGRARPALAPLGLSGRERNTPGQLSGRGQQHVAIARAVINNPRMLLADEPTGNLDTRNSHEIMKTLQSLMHRHHIRSGEGNDFSVRNLSQVAETAESSSRIMALLLAAVASISLVVGGIGIMNILLVSVTERTREIGLRMAIGARRLHVLLRFLAEAVFLGVTGGVAGIIMGIAFSKAISLAAGWPTPIAPAAIAGGFLFSAAVGIFFGYYPARKAARLDPIEALRYE